MKKILVIIFIFLLIFSTAIIKNSTKKIEDEIFAVKESLRVSENELGDKFDIRYFHDEVLCDGGITLPILENKIKSFIQEHKV